MTVTLEKSKIKYGEILIEFKISRVSSLSSKILIHVEPSGLVVVEAPFDLQQSLINKAVRKRARWITHQLSQIQKHHKYVLPRTYASGETHLYLGRRYTLKIISGNSSSVKLQRGSLIVSMKKPEKEEIKALLSKWYREHAHHYFDKRICDLVLNTPWVQNIPSMRLLKMKKQWGSCSPSKTIILNPSLIKAPRECIDYVILHELCHLQEHNHSSKFYDLLAFHMPNWKTYKHKLDLMAEVLLIDE